MATKPATPTYAVWSRPSGAAVPPMIPGKARRGIEKTAAVLAIVAAASPDATSAARIPARVSIR